MVRSLKRRRGGGDQPLVFRSGPRWHHVTGAGINDYIRELPGGDCTAKDFRTWHATVLAAVGLAVSGQAGSDAARKRAVARVVAEVAGYLGNTPGGRPRLLHRSARHPALRERPHHRRGPRRPRPRQRLRRPGHRSRAESAVLELLAVPAQPAPVH